MLTKEEKERYERQLLLDEIGEEEQKLLKRAKIAVIGAGGLGSPLLYYLAAAGVGEITIFDGDTIELSNLNRQLLYTTDDIGKKKAIQAASRIQALNPHLKIKAIAERITPKTVDQLNEYDLILEATDSLGTKYLVNDYCVAHRKPMIIAGIREFEGQVQTYLPDHACYRCVFRDVDLQEHARKKRKIATLGAVPGIVGAIQAAEAIKLLIGMKEKLLVDKLLRIDVLNHEYYVVHTRRDPTCKACGENADKELINHYNYALE